MPSILPLLTGRSWKKVTPLLAVVVALLGYLAHDIRANLRNTPPHEKCTVAELAASVPSPRHLAIVSENETPLLVWIGHIPAFTVRSGPPYYIFNAQGQLIDWCPESGEGHSADNLKTTASNSPAISWEEALHWRGKTKNSRR